MRKFFMVSFVMAIMMLMTTSVTYAQNKIGRYHFKDKYTKVETITVENATVPTENGDYLIELPVKSNLTIAYDAEHSQAIVLHSDYPFIKHMEYNVKDNDVRLVLWFMDKGKHVYCGFVYDKKSKTARYFEAINEAEKERLVKRIPFLKNTPTF